MLQQFMSLSLFSGLLMFTQPLMAQSAVESCRNAPNPAVCVGRILDAKLDQIIIAVGGVNPIPPVELQKLSVYMNLNCNSLITSIFVPKRMASQDAIELARAACAELSTAISTGVSTNSVKIGALCIDLQPRMFNYEMPGKCLEIASEQGEGQ